MNGDAHNWVLIDALQDRHFSDAIDFEWACRDCGLNWVPSEEAGPCPSPQPHT